MKTLINNLIIGLLIVGCSQGMNEKDPMANAGQGEARGVVEMTSSALSSDSAAGASQMTTASASATDAVVRVAVEWGKPRLRWFNWRQYSYDFTISSDKELVLIRAGISAAPFEYGDSAYMDGSNSIVVSTKIYGHRDGLVLEMAQGASLSITGTIRDHLSGRVVSLKELNYGAFANGEMLELLEALSPRSGYPGCVTQYHYGNQKLGVAFAIR